jgi:hypothetical protein
VKGGGIPSLGRLTSFAFRGTEIWGTTATLAPTYNNHLWRLAGTCWSAVNDGALMGALIIGAMGDRVTASDGSFWLDAPPP